MCKTSSPIPDSPTEPSDDHRDQDSQSPPSSIVKTANEAEESRRVCVSVIDLQVCRICQLGSDYLPASVGSKVNLVDLGCACKGELGVSHYYCARAWFLQKGNRTCEICGKPAKNIKGIGDTGFRALNLSSYEREREERESKCNKCLCNFILAAFILAFFLPLFFHPVKLL